MSICSNCQIPELDMKFAANQENIRIDTFIKGKGAFVYK